MTKRRKIESSFCVFVALVALIFLFREQLPYRVQRILGFSTFHAHSFPKELDYQRIQAEILAKSLVENYEGNGPCLLIHHPSTQMGMPEIKRLERAFQKGFGDKVKDIYLAPIKNINMNAAIIPEEAMMEMTAEDFNKVMGAHPYCDIIVTMVPLPFSEKEIYKMNIFKMVEDPENPNKWIKDPKQKYPRLGLFNGYLGNTEKLFHEGLIKSMTLWRPSPTIDENPVPKDPQEAFNKRYLLITPKNIKEVKTEYPSLFPKPKKRK